MTVTNTKKDPENLTFEITSHGRGIAEAIGQIDDILLAGSAA